MRLVSDKEPYDGSDWGPYYTEGGLARRVNETVDHLYALTRFGQLIAFEDSSNGELLFPVWQFQDDEVPKLYPPGGMVTGLHDVFDVILPHDETSMGDVCEWLFESRVDLGGATPLSWLKAGMGTEAVVMLLSQDDENGRWSDV